MKKYLLTLETAHTPAKSRTVRRAAAEGFAKWKGEKLAMHEVVRTDVAEWMQSLRASGLLTPTLVNKASYLKSFFAWAQSAGYYPQGDNTAAGQVKFTTSEKRQRRPLGFRPFTPAYSGEGRAPVLNAPRTILFSSVNRFTVFLCQQMNFTQVTSEVGTRTSGGCRN